MRWRASTQRLHRLDTRSATASINPRVNRPRSARPIAGLTEGRRPRVNQHQPQASTGHGQRDQSPDSPEDVRPEQGGVGTHRSWNRGQGAHGSPPVTAESSPHFRVTITEDCSCYSIARLMSEGDVGCNRDGAAGQVSPVLGHYGLQHGVGRKLSCKHGGAETVASSYCTPCCQRLHTLWHFSHAGLRLVRNCSIMSREGGQTCLLPRHRCSDSGVRDRHDRDEQP